MGSSFAFPLSQGTRPARHCKTSFGARDFGGFQDCFFRDRPMDTARIAVVGAGVVGLSTAVCISKLVPQCSVTIISDKFTPDTTSDVAAGMLIPHTYPGHVSQGRGFHVLPGEGEGPDASWHSRSSALMLLFLLPCEEGLVCFPFHHDRKFPEVSPAMLNYTPIHTQKQWFRETFNHLFAIANSAEAGDAGVHLVSGIKGSGGWMLTRRIDDLWELYPSFDIVVNCSGLGSRQLAGDAKIFPVRGQVLQVQAPWVEHFIRDGSGLTYIYPGTSHVTLGGTRQKGDWNLSPDAENSREILSRCCALEPSLHGACNIREKVGLRPYRPGVRLQTELLARDGRRLPVVHHYGHGSGGISVHWGTALEAARLVSECVHALRTPIAKSKL
ncbi:D-aspartate oxidase isoform X6 [Macaca nemestrina]|uniref:D-aspartate oxidase isoform X6 n=1 Tax=Macaca nemestrina TaxID=9545 RepID=UPI0039B946D5